MVKPIIRRICIEVPIDNNMGSFAASIKEVRRFEANTQGMNNREHLCRSSGALFL